MCFRKTSIGSIVNGSNSIELRFLQLIQEVFCKTLCIWCIPSLHNLEPSRSNFSNLWIKSNDEEFVFFFSSLSACVVFPAAFNWQFENSWLFQIHLFRIRSELVWRVCVCVRYCSCCNQFDLNFEWMKPA